MNISRSFDRAAEVYDQTRPLFEATATRGIQSILDIAGPRARILEVGSGTGRISIPLMERGANLIGCDLSARMLKRQLEKYPAARVAQSDAARLPFVSDYFDAVLTVHVMHLVGLWREALREFKRVLKPGGRYLYLSTYEPVGDSIRIRIRQYWRSRVEEKGFDARHPGVQGRDELLAELNTMGAYLTQVEAVRFSHNFTLREELDRFEARVYSDTWPIPDDIFAATATHLREWVSQEYGDLDQTHAETARFVCDVARFDE